MYEYDEEVLDTFLKKQTQLFIEEVADTPEAAEEFLEDCMAVRGIYIKHYLLAANTAAGEKCR